MQKIKITIYLIFIFNVLVFLPAHALATSNLTCDIYEESIFCPGYNPALTYDLKAVDQNLNGSQNNPGPGTTPPANTVCDPKSATQTACESGKGSWDSTKAQCTCPQQKTAPINPAIISTTDTSNGVLYNPLPVEELTSAFLIVTRWFLGIVGILAVMMIMVGGFQMTMSAGNEENLTKAKKTVTWAVIGLVISLLAFSIIAVVQNFLQAK